MLRRELDGIGIAAPPRKDRVALPPKRHTSTAEETSFPESKCVDVRIAEQGEEDVTVAGVPIDTGGNVVERAVRVAGDGSADRLRCCREPQGYGKKNCHL